MAPSANPSTTNEDHTISLINAAVTTTSIAVNSRLESLSDMMSSPLTGNGDIDKRLDGVRAELDVLVSTQKNEQEQIKKQLEETLDTEVLRHVTKEIEAQIEKCIEKTIASLVEEELNKFIPKEVREKADKQQSDIQQLYIQMHNSEARRINSFIRSPKQFGETLQHLINKRGLKSDAFPKTVKDLLELRAEKVMELVRFYDMETPNQTSRVPNINWFLSEMGVAYQLNFLG